ncbi:MAG: hypothetical protein FJ271_01930 [Planctomycetes bacterium]|nr:hypothetical protein [Planctomycetota bacterium]
MTRGRGPGSIASSAACIRKRGAGVCGEDAGALRHGNPLAISARTGGRGGGEACLGDVKIRGLGG